MAATKSKTVTRGSQIVGLINPAKRYVAWCVEHLDLGWLWSDGSGSCLEACELEIGSSECRMVPAKLTVARGVPWQL